MRLWPSLREMFPSRVKRLTKEAMGEKCLSVVGKKERSTGDKLKGEKDSERYEAPENLQERI